MEAKTRKITIDPVTRVEGHGKVTIYLDEDGVVDRANLHIVEFRGFERFVQGHPYREAPLLVQRLCGICPVSHHLAAAKAVDQIVGLDPEDLTETANKLRRLLHFAQDFQSHAVHFFYLASPDLLFGIDASAEQRQIGNVMIQHKELARQGILMRKFGQKVIKAIAGKRIHGIAAIPAGMHKTFDESERDYFLEDNDTPSIETMIHWSQGVVDFFKSYHQQHQSWLDEFASHPSGHLGTVSADGGLELYHGRLRAIDSDGNRTLDDVSPDDYLEYFTEAVEKWTYLKFPYLRHLGRENGWNRVGPLARLNVCDHIPTPLADAELKVFKAYTDGRPNNHTMHTHWARLIEMLHCAEAMQELLNDPEITSDDLRVEQREHRPEGIGVIEAPRGTLIHHYRVDDRGKITKCNLIVSTTHNNEPMNQAVKWVAKHVLERKPEITETMLNQVEIAIRAYDPCLSCATHAIGQMPLHVSLRDAQGNLISERYKEVNG